MSSPTGTVVIDCVHERAHCAGSTQSKRGQGHWAQALRKKWSGWFELALALARRWDKALHAELCVATIDQDWSLAVPVVSDLLRRKDYAAAATLTDRAFRAMLRLPAETDWDPRASLLVLRNGFT